MMTESMEKVSVIIPCFNGGIKIRKCVDSILQDSYENIEIIIVDDGSRDDTIEIIKKLKVELHDKIDVLFQNRSGANKARNHGVEHSTGRFIQFLDCDDYLINEKIKRSMDIFATDSRVLCVYTDGENDMGHNSRFSACHSNASAIISRKFNEFTFGMNTNMPIWKRDLLEEEGMGWDEELPCWQESEYYFRLLLKIKNTNKVVHLDHSCFVRDIGNSGISSKRNSTDYILGQNLALDKILDLCEKEELKTLQIEDQYGRFKYDLLKRALVGGSKEAWLNTIPAVRRYRKYGMSQLITYFPFFMLRMAYRSAIKKSVSI